MLEEPIQGEVNDVTATTNLNLYYLHKMYVHYFLRKRLHFIDLVQEIRKKTMIEFTPSDSSISRSPLSDLSTGGKKRRNTRYKGNKNNYRSSKRKTMKNHKI